MGDVTNLPMPNILKFLELEPVFPIKTTLTELYSGRENLNAVYRLTSATGVQTMFDLGIAPEDSALRVALEAELTDSSVSKVRTIQLETIQIGYLLWLAEAMQERADITPLETNIELTAGDFAQGIINNFSDIDMPYGIGVFAANGLKSAIEQYINKVSGVAELSADTMKRLFDSIYLNIHYGYTLGILEDLSLRKKLIGENI